MIRFLKTSAVLVFALIFQSAAAQDTTDHEQDHVQLRALRATIVDAINKGDIDAVNTVVHPNAVVTWQNGVVCKGRDGLKKFYDENMGAGAKKPFQGYKVPPEADELTILYSGATTGVVYGRSVGRFFLAGKEIEVPNRWTATVVKEDGKWFLASYHVSMNVLDNPLLNGVKKSAAIFAVVAMAAGLLIGWLAGRRRTKAA